MVESGKGRWKPKTNKTKANQMKTITTNKKLEYFLIKDIAVRARNIGKAHQPDFRRSIMDIMMDIEYCHESNPLNLQALLDADDFNFCHDVFGIARHFNRQTLKLEDCFVPRFT